MVEQRSSSIQFHPDKPMILVGLLIEEWMKYYLQDGKRLLCNNITANSHQIMC